MKILGFLALLGLHSAAGVIHSLKYFYTASSQVPNFPEFVVVGMVDDVEMFHCDSDTKKAELKQDWAEKAVDPQYLERNTANCLGVQPSFKANIEVAKQRFNQTGGVHIYQNMYGCEWDNVTGEVNGYDQYGYDGEDFLAWDLKTETWVAPKQQAVISKLKWDHNKALIAQRKNYYSQICVEWLKKFVNYGRSSLMRTERPSTHSLLQKTPSSPVSCFATGFYPDRAEMFWRKDGHQIHEDVERGEILPNHDGSFQMSVELDLSKVAPGDWGKYECVFQLSGVTEDIITKLDKAVIRSNEGSSEFPVGPVVGGVGGLLLLAAVVAGILGYIYCRKHGFQPVKQAADASDTSSSSSSSTGEVRVEVSDGNLPDQPRSEGDDTLQ